MSSFLISPQPSRFANTHREPQLLCSSISPLFAIVMGGDHSGNPLVPLKRDLNFHHDSDRRAACIRGRLEAILLDCFQRLLIEFEACWTNHRWLLWITVAVDNHGNNGDDFSSEILQSFWSVRRHLGIRRTQGEEV